MDIAKLYSDTRRVEWKIAGDRASIWVELRSGNADEIKAVEHEQRTAIQEAARKNRMLTPEEQDQFDTRKLAATIASWEWPEGAIFDGRTPDDSEEFKLFVLNHSNPVAIDIIERLGREVADIKGFIKKSESKPQKPSS